ncbi:hypothetical protein BT93_K0281, partial [Corymbia citriodora subsp. variegata]
MSDPFAPTFDRQSSLFRPPSLVIILGKRPAPLYRILLIRDLLIIKGEKRRRKNPESGSHSRTQKTSRKLRPSSIPGEKGRASELESEEGKVIGGLTVVARQRGGGGGGGGGGGVLGALSDEVKRKKVRELAVDFNGDRRFAYGRT